MCTFRFRAASYDDLSELNDMMFQLHKWHHESQPDHFKTPEEIEQEKSITRYLDDPECLVYVATESDSGKIAGFITGHFCELVSVVSKPVQMGSVDELYVIPEFRNRGIAKQLFIKLEQMFSDYGVKQVFVEVWEFNKEAILFYNKMAFNHHIHWMRKSL